MGRSPCCDKSKVKRGTWSPEEDAKLISYLSEHGTTGNWIALPHKAGLRRCGKSCRLRWLNYLRPDIKHGAFTQEEDNTICSLYNTLGSRWSVIASQLPGRTDNDVKNYWNTKLKKKIIPSHSNPPTKTNIETATAASGSAAAATTTTTTSGEASFFQESMYSIGLVNERKSSVSSGTMSYNNFPRLMLEGATSSDNSCNLYPSQQDLDPFNRPFNECSSEVMSDIWCQEEGFGADSNADLFSIVFQNVSYND